MPPPSPSGQSERDYPARPLLGVSVVVWHDDKVLLVKRGRPPRQGWWSLPGGLVEAGEELHAAALRELREETAISANLTGVMDWRDIIHKDDAGDVKTHYVLAVFAGHWRDGQVRAGDDAADARWMHASQFGDLQLMGGIAQTVTKAATFLRG